MSEARWKRKWKLAVEQLAEEKKFSHTAVTALNAAAARIKFLEAQAETEQRRVLEVLDKHARGSPELPEQRRWEAAAKEVKAGVKS